MNISFYIITFMFAMTLLHQINTCYMFGSTVVGCPSEPGMGHPMIPFEVNPLFGYTFKDSENRVVNASDSASFNSTFIDIVSYNPAPSGLSDVYGFFSWVVTGGKLMVNAFFFPLFGFPGYLTSFWIPTFVTYPIGGLLFLIQIVGLYEFLSGREIFKK